MRLKCIKLVGFKSFVDPTTVNFPSNLCAIVGPNGCGKSNIIDAVRWVMGESSAKNLRGEAMTDVIFNGSGGRKPVGQASIELIFDNADGKIAGEYAGYNEISVKRKVTRDAQNMYYLNGSKCRRRDITDLFLGTGLGPRSYAIIEQGMISRLIEARPEELRVYIEEAAGISKYKERRRDTENRMRRTQENLERLTDIRDELDRQLVRLKRQSQSAEKYTEYKQEERELKAQLQTFRYKKLLTRKEEKNKEISELELKVEAKVTEQVHQDSEIEKHRTQHTELSDAFNEVQGRYYALGADVSRLEQSLQHADERERQLKIDLDQTTRDCAEADEHMAADIQKSEGWEAELLEIEPELERVIAAEEISGAALLEAEDAMHHWQHDWDGFNQRAANPRQQAEVQQSRIQHLEQVQQRLLQRMDKLKEESASFAVVETENEIAELEEQVAEYALQIETQNTNLESFRETLAQAKQRERQVTEQRDELRSSLQQMKGRYASLEALQQAALADNSEELNSWKRNQGLENAARLAEQISVQQGWEVAVETVLGNNLQAVCTDKQMAELAASLESFSKGAVSILSLATQNATHNASAASLLEKVTAKFDLAPMLGNVRTANSLNDALEIQKQLAANESVITAEGIWLGPNWLRVARSDESTGSVLARKQEMETLSEQIANIETQAEESALTLDETRERIQSIEAEQEQVRRTLDDITRQQSEIKTRASAMRAKVEQVLEAKARVKRELEEANHQIENESRNLSDARRLLQEALVAMESDAEEREKFLSQRDAIRAQLDEARQRARRDKDKAHELSLRSQSIKTQLQSIKEGIKRLDEQKQRLHERREKLKEALEENRAPVAESKLELESILQKRIAVEQEMAEARRVKEHVEHAMREAEKIRHQVEQELVELRGYLESARLEAQTLSVQSENLQNQVLEEGFDLQAVLANLDDSVSEKDLEEGLGSVNNRIARLGPINLAAIDEFKIESERKSYLDAQNEDLQEALETLENAIKKIDKETRTRFKETFDQINNGLQELFPRVFGGGHAYLEMTGEDLLDTGVAIMARPPGKKNSSIHLLSGGEKALTAIALVFSIFRLNPAPFCMLDEVDAPLDDANVERYARMVKESSRDIQFIYITHNKIAMEMAQQLMGVTMHEPGVSRMVTVDVDEAAELAAV